MILRHKCWCSKIWVSAQNHNWKAVSVFIFFTFCRFPGESWSSCLRSLRVGAWPGWTTNRRFKWKTPQRDLSIHKHLDYVIPRRLSVVCLFVYMFILPPRVRARSVVCLFTCLFCCPPGHEHNVFFNSQVTSTRAKRSQRCRPGLKRNRRLEGKL